MLLDFVVKPKNGVFACFCSCLYLASFGVDTETPFLGITKKSNTLTRAVWAEGSESAPGTKIGPRQQKL